MLSLVVRLLVPHQQPQVLLLHPILPVASPSSTSAYYRVKTHHLHPLPAVAVVVEVVVEAAAVVVAEVEVVEVLLLPMVAEEGVLRLVPLLPVVLPDPPRVEVEEVVAVVVEEVLLHHLLLLQSYRVLMFSRVFSFPPFPCWRRAPVQVLAGFLAAVFYRVVKW